MILRSCRNKNKNILMLVYFEREKMIDKSNLACAVDFVPRFSEKKITFNGDRGKRQYLSVVNSIDSGVSL